MLCYHTAALTLVTAIDIVWFSDALACDPESHMSHCAGTGHF